MLVFLADISLLNVCLNKALPDQQKVNKKEFKP